MAPRTITLVLPLLLTGLLIAAACGDSTESGTTTTAESSTTTTAEPTTTLSTSTTTTTEPSTTTATQQEQEVTVYFSSGDGTDCAEVTGVERTISIASASDAELLTATLEQLVAGPTAAETESDIGSFFSQETADVLRSVRLDESLAIVDFADLRALMPNASTSCGSAALVSQLNETVLQYESVDRVRYTMEGSCDLFNNWLQGECADFTTDGRAEDVALNDRASYSGCTPGSGDLPDGRWFGYVDMVTDGDISFDLACWFVGVAAAEAAAADGEESPPPNDYYIRNDSDQRRVIPASADTEVVWLEDTGPTATTIEFGEWVVRRGDRSFQPGVWLTIEAGTVVSVEEQYVP